MKVTADRKAREEKMSKRDLFWRVVMTGLIAFVIVVVAIGLIALVVWGIYLVGAAAVFPLLILIGLAIAGSWSIVGWLME